MSHLRREGERRDAISWMRRASAVHMALGRPRPLGSTLRSATVDVRFTGARRHPAAVLARLM